MGNRMAAQARFYYYSLEYSVFYALSSDQDHERENYLKSWLYLACYRTCTFNMPVWYGTRKQRTVHFPYKYIRTLHTERYSTEGFIHYPLYGSKMYGTLSHLCSDGSCRLQSRNKSGLFKGYAPRRLSEKGRKFFKRKISLWWSHQDTHSGWNSQKPRMKEKYRYFPLCLSTWKINVTLIFISQFQVL